MTPAERAMVCQVADVIDWLADEVELGRDRPDALRGLARRLRYGPDTGCRRCGNPLPPPQRTGRRRVLCLDCSPTRRSGKPSEKSTVAA